MLGMRSSFILPIVTHLHLVIRQPGVPGLAGAEDGGEAGGRHAAEGGEAPGGVAPVLLLLGPGPGVEAVDVPLPAEPGPQRPDRVGDGEAPYQVLGSNIH